eukprot:2543201-Rhodomonas_salina.4
MDTDSRCVICLQDQMRQVTACGIQLEVLLQIRKQSKAVHNDGTLCRQMLIFSSENDSEALH